MPDQRITIDSPSALAPLLSWPRGDVTHVPYGVYEDPAVYALEQTRIFRGPTWNYVGLEIELAKAGDYVTNHIGDTPVVIIRRPDGSLAGFVNRCPHKGSMICYEATGNATRLSCPYHNWVFDLDGRLRSVAFRDGIRGAGGMPADFDMADHSLTRLKVESLAGLVFASFDPGIMPLTDYLGPRLVAHVQRTLMKPYKIIGRCSQLMHSNWKLYAENSRDTYHPSLLHSFATIFKLNRLSAEGGVEMDEAGWHHLVFARRHTDQGDGDYRAAALRTDETGYGLADPRLIEDWVEWDDGITNSIMTLFPCLNLQQSLNTMAVRQLVQRSPEECELYWTFLGFEDDTPEEAKIRQRQCNMFGPAGYISLEDGAIGEFVQRAIRNDPLPTTIIEMGGREVGPSPKTRATETSVRGFWRTWRELMDL